MQDYVYFKIPVPDMPIRGNQPGDMRVKLHAALDELMTEVESTGYDQRKALDLLIHSSSTMIGLMYSEARERLSERSARNTVVDVVCRANQGYVDGMVQS